MKGITKIELFDATTGDKTNEVVEENMITNALNNILNPPLQPLLSGDSARPHSVQDVGFFMHGIYPLHETLLGGIMLFSEKPEENANNIIPTVQVAQSCVGYASHSASAVESNMRGSFNGVESGAVENGYKLVWDFTPSQALGLISSVCLTSAYGGIGGWNTKDQSIRRPVICMPSTYYQSKYLKDLTTETVVTGNIVYGSDVGTSNITLPLVGEGLETYTRKIAVLPKGNYVYFIASDGGLNYLVRRKSLVGKRSFLDSFENSNFNDGVFKDYKFTISKRYTSGTYIVMQDRVCSVMRDSDTQISLLEFKVNNQSDMEMSESTVTIQGLKFPSGINSYLVDDDNIYMGGIASDATKLYTFSRKSSGEATAINLPDSVSWTSSTFITKFFNTIFLTGKESTTPYTYYLGADGQTWYPYAGFDGAYPSPVVFENILPLPWVLLENVKEPTNLKICLWSGYLASINNLSQPVTKTSDKSMKITYTLLVE